MKRTLSIVLVFSLMLSAFVLASCKGTDKDAQNTAPPHSAASETAAPTDTPAAAPETEAPTADPNPRPDPVTVEWLAGEMQRRYYVGCMNLELMDFSDIMKNRNEYCSKHNYVCLFPELNQVIDKKYNRWKATCLLQKLFSKGTEIKEGDWVWYLDPTVVITNVDTPVGDVLLQPDSLKARLSYGSRFITGKL